MSIWPKETRPLPYPFNRDCGPRNLTWSDQNPLNRSGVPIELPIDNRRRTIAIGTATERANSGKPISSALRKCFHDGSVAPFEASVQQGCRAEPWSSRPARARMHVVAPRFKKWFIARKRKTLKRIRPMKKIPVVFAACLFAGSAIALEATQDTPNQTQSTGPTPEAAAPSPKPAAEAPAPSPKPAAEAPAPSSKPTAEAPAPRRAAKGAKPEVAPEHKTEKTSRNAYLRALTAEIRKHTPGNSKLSEG